LLLDELLLVPALPHPAVATAKATNVGIRSSRVINFM